jgi:hypothetical protein
VPVGWGGERVADVVEAHERPTFIVVIPIAAFETLPSSFVANLCESARRRPAAAAIVSIALKNNY